MEYKSVTKTAKEWKLSDRTVRKYCEQGKIQGAFLTGKTWNIPIEATPPLKSGTKKDIDNTLLGILKYEKDNKIKGGIYHKIQVLLTYNSNHIEGSTLTEEQTRRIFETNTIGGDELTVRVDDIVESINHFRCIDYIITSAKKPLSESIIKRLHLMLKSGTQDSFKEWFKIGSYKERPNEVGGEETCHPLKVKEQIKFLIEQYNSIEKKSIKDIVDFHYKFEKIHPFQDGNGRVGRLIMFKECLKSDVVPFIIDEKHRFYYYRGLKEYKTEKGFLLDTCLSCQDIFKEWLKYFEIEY